MESAVSVRYCSMLSMVMLLATEVELLGCLGEEEICVKCRCQEYNEVVDCTGIGLTEVPAVLPFGLRILNLRDNNISRVDSHAFDDCVHLSRLDLASNFIRQLPDNLFLTPATSLRILRLENNGLIVHQNSSLFRPLNRSLTALYVQKNGEISHDALEGLASLEILHLDGNAEGRFGVGFASLRSLRSLKIYSPLDSLTNETFKHFGGCSNLTTLDASNAGIASMDSNCFRPLTSLLHLNLGYNNRLSLESASNSFDSLPDRLEELVLTGLVGNFRPTLTVSKAIVKKLGKKSLKKLKLNKNEIIYIDNTFSMTLNHLEYLDISFNRYSNTISLAGLGFFMVNVTFLNADMQSRRPKFSQSDDEQIEPSPQRRVQKNVRVSPSFRSPEHPPLSPAAMKYSKDSCTVGTFRPCTFPLSSDLGDVSWCLPTPRNLKVLRLNGGLNEQMDEYPPIIFLGNFRLEEMYFGENGIQMVRGPFVADRPVAERPLTLDYSYNDIFCFAPNAFEISIKRGLIIGKINLEGNELSEQLRQDKKGDTFALYADLKELNLANNRLKFLNWMSFRNLHSLEILNLSANSLQLLHFDILSLKSLRHLDLSNNLFVTFDKHLTSTFTSISSSRGFDSLSLFIRGNPFQCNCVTLDFLYWISRNATKIECLAMVTCLYDSSRDVSLNSTASLRMNLKWTCYYALPLIVAGGLVALLMLSILVGVVSHRYRWDIRYYLLKHAQMKKRYLLFLEQKNDYQFDAFVSYDTRDRQWIVRELIVNLEMGGAEPEKGGGVRSKDGIDASWSDSKSRNPARHTNYGTISEPCGIDSVCTDVRVGREDRVSIPAVGDHKSLTFELCVHERDFEPGNSIESNIMNAIQNSRMVILVVSNHFIKSNWCRLELEMAKMESLERGRNVVITIFLEPIQETLESLEWLMKRYTYLEWYKCNTSSKKEEFWKMVKVALGSVRAQMTNSKKNEES